MSEWADLDVGATAGAALAVVAEPLAAVGLLHRPLDHPLAVALLHEALLLRRRRQVVVPQAPQLV